MLGDAFHGNLRVREDASVLVEDDAHVDVSDEGDLAPVAQVLRLAQRLRGVTGRRGAIEALARRLLIDSQDGTEAHD